jgi:hypothetical protein
MGIEAVYPHKRNTIPPSICRKCLNKMTLPEAPLLRKMESKKTAFQKPSTGEFSAVDLLPVQL